MPNKNKDNDQIAETYSESVEMSDAFKQTRHMFTMVKCVFAESFFHTFGNPPSPTRGIVILNGTQEQAGAFLKKRGWELLEPKVYTDGKAIMTLIYEGKYVMEEPSNSN